MEYENGSNIWGHPISVLKKTPGTKDLAQDQKEKNDLNFLSEGIYYLTDFEISERLTLGL